MNFSKTFNSDYIHCGKIDLPWDQVEQDLKSIEKDNYRSQNIASGSNDYGADGLQNILDEYRKYGYTEHNTVIWKTTARIPKLTFGWEQQIIDQLPLDHAIATVTRQDPGQILPWHEDKFFMLRRLNPEDTRPIWRFLLMMEDWKMGHLLQIKDSMLTHWKRGDVYVWHPGAMHVAANVGFEVKWTCNITGFLNV
jgi:hypothetical protein